MAFDVWALGGVSVVNDAQPVGCHILLGMVLNRKIYPE